MSVAKPEIELRRIDPAKPFFITGDVMLDGSAALEDDTPYSLEAAIEHAKGLVEEHGGAMFVIECRCVRKVVRGKTRVTPIKKRSAA